MVVDVALDAEEWVAQQAPALLRFAHLVTGDADAAQDAVQDALANAFARWDRVAATEDPGAYVRRMIVNAHVSAWRRFGRRVVPVAEVRGGSVVDAANAVARDDAVWRVCRGLPAKQRAAVVLRYYEDLEFSEIARILGCSEGTVRSQLHRALAALRTELTRQEADDG
jgi:RNA polymerase sigma-70 factor (sigma-E family)